MVNRRLFIGFTLAAVLVLLVGCVSYFTLKKQETQQVWVEHTYKVLNQAREIERLVVDMETGRRGFRCTNDKTFLEPYYISQPKLAPALLVIRDLVSDNPEQRARVQNLEFSCRRIDSLWRSINIATIAADQEQRRVITQSEKILTDAVRTDLSKINNAENDLLKQRQRNSSDAIEQAVITVVVGTLLILFVVIGMIRLILKENRSRLRAELALKDKLEELNRTNIATQAMNWMLTGLREINGSLIGNDSLKELVSNSLQKIADYLQVPAAAFYFFDKQKNELILLSSMALPAGVPQKLKLNEGIAGNAATRREVTVTKNVPEHYWKIGSSTGAALPDAVICVPLWSKNELMGVIELGCFGSNTDQLVSLLTEIANNIAIGIQGAHANDLSAILLGKVQEQKEELENQQEELRQTNEELIQQAEILRASEEELRTQEEELRQVNVELEEKTEAVENARASLQFKANELEATSRYKSEFLANMSHELRTPLNSVLILANLLKENKQNNLTSKQAEYAKIIHKSGSDLLNLINDILDLSKIEAGKIDFHFEDVKLDDIGYDMEQLFMVVAGDKKISFSIDKADGIPETVNTDKQRIEQVIKNLLSNAFKFTPEDGRVSLGFHMDGHNLAISVADSGIGIPQEKQRIIFEAFQQADGSTSRRFGGTGLGLSISKELVSRMDGEIELISKVGEGSTFTIVLPLKGEPVVRTTTTAANNSALPKYDLTKVKEQTIIKDDKPEIKKGEQSVLLIEDDIVFAGIVNNFAHEKGYKTIIAVSGDEGLLYARKYKPSAIILDLGLPVIDGRNILKILKSDEELKHIPVHIISSEDRTDIAAGDIETYVRKPLLKDELELTFSSIGTYIQANYRNILILMPDNKQLQDMFESLTSEMNSGILYDMVETKENALRILADKGIDCIIADIGADIAQGIITVKDLKLAAGAETYIITCLEADISSADEKRLKMYSDSVIRRSVQAKSRLLDEVELFLHRINNSRRPAIPEKYHSATDKSLDGKKVLVADDDMRNVFALTAMLEEQGMNVITAEDGREALDMLAQNKDVDIVLMDIMMPEMDGYEAMRHIRADGKHAKLPVIALTAKAMAGDREKCIDAGASDYITKPIDNNKLLSLMRVWLS